ncbi:transposase [Mycobacterium sp. ACS1612]|uniref:class I SAM-dependent methyltransferase n=1 Tax=Mycobacterium sp. ACS1612 TaxID=1834117 RepID=UPI0007FEE228|nr:class I SAM-dependent methyltransferase [Mycobacterium sp. ACS1612]OBF30313.1 transposase [Mycobacterium sp. ACS1612]
MAIPPGKVVYMDIDELWNGYEDLLVDLAKREGAKSVAELGGGANPIVADSNWDFLQQRVVVDISAQELAKGEGVVETRVADLCQPINGGHNSYDMVFSKMLVEHLPDPVAFHENCFKLLRPGGLSVHFFPTLHSLPILVNHLIPEKQAHALVRFFQPSRIADPKQQKFPAYYRWCLGPSERTAKRYESAGFEVERINATFGHGYYRRIPPLHGLEQLKMKMLHRHPVPYMASFMVVILRKPHVGYESGAASSSATAPEKAIRNASG